MAASLGLDKSYPVQYLIWLRDFISGDFGKSLLNGMDVRDMILEKLPITLELLVVSMILAIVLAVIFGVTSAIYKGSWFDQLIRLLSTGFLAVPAFCLGLIFILIFAVKLKWLPSMGYVPFTEDPIGHLKCLAMPVLAMALMEQASLTRYIRSEMLEVLGSNYVRTAKAKGLTKNSVYYRHAFKNVSVTVITLIGMRIGQLIGGAVVIEQVFSWGGIGWYLYSSITSQDYPAVQATVLLIAAIMVLLNMVATSCTPPSTRGSSWTETRREDMKKLGSEANHAGWKRRHLRFTTVFAIAILLIALTAALFPSLLTSYDPTAIDMKNKLSGPAAATGLAPMNTAGTSGHGSSTAPGPACRWASARRRWPC